MLIAAMQGPDQSLASTAMLSLGKFGTNARPLVPQLIIALDHQDLGRRYAATNAVNAIAPEFFKTNGIKVRTMLVNPEGTFIGNGQVPPKWTECTS